MDQNLKQYKRVPFHLQPSEELKARLLKKRLNSAECTRIMEELRRRALLMQCDRHPRYRGMNKPAEVRKCDKCEKIWEAWQF